MHLQHPQLPFNINSNWTYKILFVSDIYFYSRSFESVSVASSLFSIESVCARSLSTSQVFNCFQLQFHISTNYSWIIFVSSLVRRKRITGAVHCAHSAAMHHAASYDTFATFTQLVIIVFLRFILYILFINKQKWTRRLHDNLIYTKNFLCMLRMRLCNQR